jgi:hypothetical protein
MTGGKNTAKAIAIASGMMMRITVLAEDSDEVASAPIPIVTL